MLTQLKIRNLILIDSADILFDKGLNIITGETGAGKSAILSAIALLTGDRSDAQLIGKNGDIAVVEAFLSNGVLIRREIHKSGRNRCFSGEEQISLALLRQIVGSTIELVDQSSAPLLCVAEEQRRMLDLFGDILEDAGEFGRSFVEERELQKRLDGLLQASETRSRDLTWAEEDLKLLDSVNWRQGEEELLMQEHRLHAHMQELLEKMGSVSNFLGDLSIKRALSILSGCAKLDANLGSLVGQLQSANCEIEDVKGSVHSYVTRLDADPQRLSWVEERLAKIDQIKRKFGKTVALVQEKKKELLHRIEALNNLEEELLSLQSLLRKKQEENRCMAKELMGRRKKAALAFSGVVLKELQTLNLPHAKFTISVEETEMTAHGSDLIRYLFSANSGHMPIPVEQCASGGELSRLLFSIKLALVDKEKTDCLIFDEIDSNVGGQTATILGEKLKTIAKKRQVICVTHFVQVARSAMTHFAVAKNEEGGKTTTSISKLTDREKGREYERMLGNLK